MKIYDPRITALLRWLNWLVIFFASVVFAACAGGKETIPPEEVVEGGGEETPPGPTQEEIDAALKAKEEAELLDKKRAMVARLIEKQWKFSAEYCGVVTHVHGVYYESRFMGIAKNSLMTIEDDRSCSSKARDHLARDLAHFNDLYAVDADQDFYGNAKHTIYSVALDGSIRKTFDVFRSDPDIPSNSHHFSVVVDPDTSDLAFIYFFLSKPDHKRILFKSFHPRTGNASPPPTQVWEGALQEIEFIRAVPLPGPRVRLYLRTDDDRMIALTSDLEDFTKFQREDLLDVPPFRTGVAFSPDAVYATICGENLCFSADGIEWSKASSTILPNSDGCVRLEAYDIQPFLDTCLTRPVDDPNSFILLDPPFDSSRSIPLYPPAVHDLLFVDSERLQLFITWILPRISYTLPGSGYGYGTLDKVAQFLALSSN